LKKKYHLVRWKKVCKVRKKEGLGLKDLRRMNISLLCKWWWLLETGEELRQDIVRKKYVKNSPTCLIPFRMTDSPLWKDLMKVRYIYLRGRRYKIGNSKYVSFCLDAWLGEKLYA
jgi:hypothetical protein